MKLIDRDTLVAEIKELIRANELYLSESNTDEIRFQKVGAYSVLNNLLHFINTLEVKEVDLEKEIDEVIHNYNLNNHRHTSICSADIEWIAKHFFELGLKSYKGK